MSSAVPCSIVMTCAVPQATASLIGVIIFIQPSLSHAYNPWWQINILQLYLKMLTATSCIVLPGARIGKHQLKSIWAIIEKYLKVVIVVRCAVEMDQRSVGLCMRHPAAPSMSRMKLILVGLTNSWLIHHVRNYQFRYNFLFNPILPSLLQKLQCFPSWCWS